MLVHETVGRFLADLIAEGRSRHTIAAYRRDLDTFSRFTGEIDIGSVTPELLTRFMASKSVQVGPCGTVRGKSTINRYRVSLKALFAWCGDRWLIERNPATILKCRRHRALPPGVLTDKEIGEFGAFPFAGKWAERDRAMVLFMLGTGCRLGETVALDVGDIDFELGRVTLRSPKGGEPDQLITSELVCQRLLPLADAANPTQPLFRTSRDSRLSCRQVQRIVAQRCLEAGISKPVTPHTLRHTFATRLYNRTRDIRLVQEALRHGFITTTQRYAQVDPDRLAAALESAAAAS